MNEIKKYWRDKVIQLLGVGTAVLVVIASWSLVYSERFELGFLAGKSSDYGNSIRAIALLLFVVVFVIVWRFAINWIYRNHLTSNVDETVLPLRFVHIYSTIVSVSIIAVSCLLALA